jgi:light-regulated signal transduction histidine kinase (bacteriophytochrome)
MGFGHWLSVVIGYMWGIALPALLFVLMASLAFVAAGWRARQQMLRRQGTRSNANRFELAQTPFASGLMDVAAEAAAVLRQLEGLAAKNFVALDVAIQPQLAVRADARVFREILGDVVAHAIGQSPCGRVLLGAARLGGRVQVSVCDDGAGVDRDVQASELRSAERLAAMQGATMEVDARAGQGTTIVLRLPEPVTTRRDATQPTPTDPASVWTTPSRANSWETNGASR